MSKEFKVGDKVYYPMHGNRIYTIHDKYVSMSEDYPLWVNGGSFTLDGKYQSNRPIPDLLHTTPENHELLEKLYGVEFEKPPTKPTGNEIVQAMLARGDKYVPCWLSDGHQCPNSAQETDFVTAIADDLSYVTTVTGFEWDYATPFDPRTGKAITELPE